VPIGILPLGTANNIAHDLGVDRPLRDLIESWKDGKTRKFNIGVAKGPWGKANFVEALGIGLFAQMMPIVEALGSDRSHASGAEHMQFELETLNSLIKACRSPEWEIKLDDKVIDGKFLMVEVMNITTVGPGLLLAPKANSGDDFFDVVLIEKDHRADLENYLNLCLSTKRPPADFPIRKAKQVELLWQGSTVHLDSSLWSSADDRPKGVKKPKKDPPYPIEVRLESKALNILVPEE
jgi:diacylglycerol kinase family enzyme